MLTFRQFIKENVFLALGAHVATEIGRRKKAGDTRSPREIYKDVRRDYAEKLRARDKPENQPLLPWSWKKRSRLDEGNPLARMHKHTESGRHFVGISAARPNQTSSERKKAMKKLKKHFRDNGYGFRKSEGHYEGDKEPSIIVHAKAPGRKAGAELMRVAREAGKRFDQDSVLHHNGKTARLVGTNRTGFPGEGASEKVGTRLKYNNPESPFQTELRPKGKHQKGHEARFTT